MTRLFHLSLSPEGLARHPEVLHLAADAGVTDVWITGFLYGHWYYPIELSERCRRQVEAAGMRAHIVDVPLGHPGDSLGSSEGAPLIPPPHWRRALRADGSQSYGTSIHPPAVQENVEAMRLRHHLGIKRIFLDDDFRLAVSPGAIGGCFCEEHLTAFQRRTARPASDIDQLRADARLRRYSPVLHDWVEYICDELSDAWRAIRNAAHPTDLGIMVMYMGAEKAGIRLPDYRRALFRVGELHFSDSEFAPVKGKTNELFSALMHRRFCAPDRAYSETTAYPADALSAGNMAAKLNVSLFADVRHTMLMSGITPFPMAHWDTLKQAFRRQRQLHAEVKGLTPKGPLKHFWGLHGRYAGDDNPWSLFLASGIPFEVVANPPRDGWTFLGDADAHAIEAGLVTRPRGRCISRAGGRYSEALPETLEALWKWKRGITPMLRDVPWIEQDHPAVIAWYPQRHLALVWNLLSEPAELVIRRGNHSRPITVGPLDSVLVRGLS